MILPTAYLDHVAGKACSSRSTGRHFSQRVGVTRMDPIFEHFCLACGAGASFSFGGDFAAGVPGLWSCVAHRDQAERKWKRS
jgi:hypothetical protein